MGKKLEALLFAAGKPLSVEEISKITGSPKGDVQAGIDELEADLEKRGIKLVRKKNGTEEEVMLSTAPEHSSVIGEIRKDELEREIGKAALETLAIILYRGPVTRADIDYIRGVNSSFMLRALLVRGLIERTVNPEDSRSFLYQATFDLLSHLGVTSIEKLPEYKEFQKEMAEFVKTETESHESR